MLQVVFVVVSVGAYFGGALLLYGFLVYLDARKNLPSPTTRETLFASILWPITLVAFVALVFFVAPFSHVERLAKRLGEKHRKGSR